MAELSFLSPLKALPLLGVDVTDPVLGSVLRALPPLLLTREWVDL